MPNQKAIAISLASAFVAECESSSIPHETMLLAFGIATGVLLSKDIIAKLLDDPVTVSRIAKSQSCDFVLPDLPDDKVDFAIRRFAEGLAEKRQIQLKPIDPRISGEAASPAFN